MVRKRDFAEDAREQTERIRSALKAEVRKQDVRQADLEALLGRSHGYYSHLFGGRLALSMEGALEILLAIGSDPAEFFATVLSPEGKKAKSAPTTEEIEATVLRALKRYGYASGGEAEKDEEKEGKGRG
jgi:hypothetical protein